MLKTRGLNPMNKGQSLFRKKICLCFKFSFVLSQPNIINHHLDYHVVIRTIGIYTDRQTSSSTLGTRQGDCEVGGSSYYEPHHSNPSGSGYSINQEVLERSNAMGLHSTIV